MFMPHNVPYTACPTLALLFLCLVSNALSQETASFPSGWSAEAPREDSWPIDRLFR